MSVIEIFNFEASAVRTKLIDEEPWFVGKDIAEILGYSEPHKAIQRHVDEEDRMKHPIPTTSGTQEMFLVNESGMYGLVFGSKMPNATKFKRWVTNEVLPSIRKTGGYQIPKDPMSALKLMFQATEETKEDVEEVKKRVYNLEENSSLSPGEYNYLSRRISQRVFQVGRDRSYNMNKKQKSELFKALNSEISSITGVKTRSQLKNKHFNSVIDFIDDWEPSKATTVVVKQLELEGI